MSRRLFARLSVAVLAALALWLAPGSASAYPWMIRHNYTGCIVCHADPSGGGVLTEYGRAQGDLLLRTRYGELSDEEAMEPATTAAFLWGAVSPPEWLLMGGSLRGLMLTTKAQGAPGETRFIQMQADVRAAVVKDWFRAGASIGYAHEGALPASITSRAGDNLVSREHWAGVSLEDNTVLLRAGRLNLPFGVRNVEHTLWVRSATRTDINTAQQHGVAASYSGESWRGEVMAIVGNFQIRPDDYRERGYSLFAEYAPLPAWSFGVSSLVTTTLLDIRARTTLLRQAHGLFLRGSPTEKLVLTAEGNGLISSPAGGGTTLGYAGMAQGDFEVLQGLHMMSTLEIMNDGAMGASPSLGAWLGSAWFFAPHADLRIDGVLQSFPTPAARILGTTLLTQVHVYL